MCQPALCRQEKVTVLVGTSLQGWDRRGWGQQGTALLPVLFFSLPSEPHIRGS